MAETRCCRQRVSGSLVWLAEMPPRTFRFPLRGQVAETVAEGVAGVVCFLVLGAYTEPLDPLRLMVELHVKEDDPQFNSLGPVLAVLSINMPNLPNPGTRHFYCKTWDENEGMLEALVAAGAVHVVNPEGIPIHAHGPKAYHVEVAWPDSDCKVDIPSEAELQRKAEDWGRFFSNTCTMHLGM